MQQQSALRTVAAGLIGNVLEWFDFAVYGFFSAEISKQFFPTSMDKADRDLFTFLILWIGFAARPLGGVVLGMVGDRIGRRALLTVSIALMGLATLVIGCLPTYATIGIAAPILLTLMRIIQGFSLGGEFTGSMVYTTELASPLMRGIVASSTAAGTTLGFMLGLSSSWAINAGLGHEAAAEWGWRIPFLGSLVLCVLGYLLRNGIHESEVGEKAAAERAPIFKSLVGDWKPILQTFGIIALTNAGYYLVITGVERRRAEDSAFQAVTMITFAIVLVAKVFGGWVSDRVGRRRLMIGLTVAMMASVYFAQDFMIHGSLGTFMIGELMLGIPVAMAFGLQGAMVVEIFPLRTRVTSMSFAYSMTLVLSGGAMPLISTWLIDKVHSPLAPALWTLGYGLIGLPILLTMGDTNKNRLDK